MADYIKAEIIEEKQVDEDYVYEIDAPIVEDLFEPDVTSIDGRGYNSSWEQRAAAKDDALKQGYEKRAVVVLSSISTYFRDEPCHWGIILDVISYNYGPEKYFAPIEVKWLTGKTSYHYPDELIICMYAPDDQDLQSIRRGDD